MGPRTEGVKTALRASGRAQPTAIRKGQHQSDSIGSTEESPEDVPKFVFLPHEGTSRSSTRRTERLECFFDRIKAYNTEAISGVCAKVDVVEAKAKDRDMALATSLLLLQGTIRENEANRHADVEYQRVQIGQFIDEIMRHFPQSHPSTSIF